MLVTLLLIHLILLLCYAQLSPLNYVKLTINGTEEYI